MKNAISVEQSRAARGLLDWSRDDLAAASGVPARTIADFELSNTSPRDRTITAIRAALETAGVEFIPENGGGAGVRLRKAPSTTATAAPPPFAETTAVALDALPTKAAGDAEAQDDAPNAGSKGD